MTVSVSVGRVRFVAASLVVVATIGCSGAYSSSGPSTNTTQPPPAGTPNSVVVTNNAFTPETLSATAGSTVTWTWDSCSGGDGYGYGGTCTAHNVVFDDGQTSGSMSSGTYTRTFATAGTYPYHCKIHGVSMSGTVVVK
jgi:plastocyanin